MTELQTYKESSEESELSGGSRGGAKVRYGTEDHTKRKLSHTITSGVNRWGWSRPGRDEPSWFLNHRLYMCACSCANEMESSYCVRHNKLTNLLGMA